MKNVSLLATASILAVSLAVPAFAQSDLVGISNLDDRIDDIERDVADDMARAEDAARFGSPESRQGLSGSASLGYSGKTGNNESQDLLLGLRIRHGAGPLVQTIGAALDYSETDGSATKKDVFAIYDVNYYFTDHVYGFVLGRIQSDGMADELTATELADGVTLADKVKHDGFLGFGPGYRIVNTPDMAWRVQAGIGVSYLEYGDGRSETEGAGIVSSRFFYKINDNVFLTNDTDILNSDSALRANNDFGVNFKITDAISTRMSYLSEYNDSRAIKTDNKLGISVVFGF
ncbi:DUF481 domain-containing protein [Pseudogemmobacter blasticus]|uniref:DUF481 domain-containing protein n=1 Tax=Fuscovulum blasticum DSM 2131 TaxID=1188250 RepID=A0A2T4J919_FUSBL|nr:DUF481 domain-containing protein [Fuscovulum blasticum]AWD21117.1 hypothetical protein B6K69_05075 [Fuscovulum blasticum]PTE14353.1 DUF481 domain-containing protein [Fuscovulum blasticum DSM 2131]